MKPRWILGLTAITLLVIPQSTPAEQPDFPILIRGRISDDEPLESRWKRNLEIRKIIREDIARKQPRLSLGEVVFDLEGILPVLKADNNSKPYSQCLSNFAEVPRVVQIKDDLVLIEYASTLGWASRTRLVTLSQLEAASTAYLSKHSQDADAYAQRATLRAVGGRTDEALSDATRATKLRPKRTTFLLLRAGLWLIKKQLKPALDDLDELVSLDKQNSSLYVIRALVLISVDDYARAFPDLSEAIRLGNQEVNVFRMLFTTRGCVRLDKKDYTAAAEDFTKALEYLPKDEAGRGVKEALLHFKRGCSYQGGGRPYAAIAEFTRAIELDPTVGVIFLERANTYESLHESRLALADFDEAIRLMPDNSSGYVLRGVLLFQEGEFDKATNDATAAIAIEPGSYLLWAGRAAYRSAKKDIRGALDDLTQAHRLNFNSIEILEVRAQVYDQLGDSAKADADRKEAEHLKRFRESREAIQNFRK